MSSPTLEDTISLALKAHLGQKDKIGQPYILHPLRVMFSVNTKAEKMTALLHDVVEDTSITLEDLKQKGYSIEVLEAIDLLTKHDGQNYTKYLNGLSSNKIARHVKLADLEDNMDVRRLSKISPKDVKRLNRYLKAYDFLKSLE